MTSPAAVSLAKRSVLLVGALALLTYWPVLFGKVPFPADLVTQFPPWESVRGPDFRPPAHAEMGDLVTELYPWKAFTRRAIAGGAMPLWNPHLLLGAPFAGDLQTGLFYPPNLIYFFLPTALAWSLSFILRTVLAGVLATLLAKALGATRSAALTAGVLFAFCGWVTAFQTRPHLDTSLWLPLVFLGVERLRRRLDGCSVALTALAFALPVLAGQPENAAHVTAVGLVFFLYRLALPPQQGAPPAGRLRFAALFAAAGLLALGLAAVQMLPGLEFIGQLERGFHLFWGPKPLHEIGAFLSRDLGATPNSADVAIPESAAYTGMLTLLVAPLAILHRNRRDAILFAALVACVLQIVYGRGPIYWVFEHVPILNSIPNGRLLVVADLSLAVLAALGISALEEELGAGRRLHPRWWLLPAAALTASGVGVAVILARANPVPHRDGLLSLWTFRQPLSSAAFLLAAAVLLGLALAGRIRRGRFAALALAFCAVDLVTASYRFIPFVRPTEIFPPAPTFRFMKEDPAPHRVASVDMTYGSSFELMYGLDSATGYTVVLRRTTELLSSLGFKGDAPGLISERIVQSRNRLLDLMNVKYLAATTWNRSAAELASVPEHFRLVFADGSVRVFENLLVLPRAFLVPVSGALILPDEDAQLAHLRAPDFDPVKSVILSERPPTPRRDGAGSGDRPAVSEVSAVEQRINDVSLRVKAAEPGILVLSQMHYPGWKALVDGNETPLLRVDYGFLGAALGPGTHTVRFVYRPESLRIGALLSAAAFLICLALWGVRRPAPTAAPRARRQTSTPDRPES
ncbi:MAG: YfhO family protein [Thermoanaerobaculia bacterium]